MSEFRIGQRVKVRGTEEVITIRDRVDLLAYMNKSRYAYYDRSHREFAARGWWEHDLVALSMTPFEARVQSYICRELSDG